MTSQIEKFNKRLEKSTAYQTMKKKEAAAAEKKAIDNIVIGTTRN